MTQRPRLFAKGCIDVAEDRCSTSRAPLASRWAWARAAHRVAAVMAAAQALHDEHQAKHQPCRCAVLEAALLRLARTGADVVARQPDGTWLYAVDNPFGVATPAAKP